MAKQTQIIRFPKKYVELLSTLTDEQVWQLIKWLFIWNSEWLEWVILVYYNMIFTDLNNLESSAVNGGKWWRPKKPKTPGYEKNKPPVIDNSKPGDIKNNNLKERESRDKEKEKEKVEYGETWVVKLTQQQYDRLINDYWSKIIDSYILKIEEYVVNKRKWKGYDDNNLTIRKRLNKDDIKKKVPLKKKEEWSKEKRLAWEYAVK